MTPPLHLILHKVRGEPAFDVAYRMTFGSEEGWLIPTSGHRAYPAHHWKIDENLLGEDYWLPLPPDLRDHYTINTPPKREPPTQRAQSLLASLGLVRTPGPVKRRTIG